MWNPFSRKTVEKPSNVRIDVEDLADQGYSCKEIAAELGISEDEVYRIKSAKLRRMARLSGKSDSAEADRIQQLKEELAAVELQDRIDEAKHRAFLRQQERSEYEYDDAEEIVESAENPDKLLQTLLLNAVLKNQKQPEMPVPQVSPPEKAGEVSSVSSPAPLDFQKITAAIKAGVLTEERFIKESAVLNLAPDKAKDLYAFIKKKL